MARLKVEISRTAEKQLQRMQGKDRTRVAKAMVALGDDPHPPGSRKLVGLEDVFRIRVGVYRVIYSVSERRLVVIVLKIGHRRDVYRR